MHEKSSRKSALQYFFLMTLTHFFLCDSLKTLLRQGYRSGEALKKLITVAETLGYCHEKGIVHRDLKPDNIVIEHASGRPVLIDFGLIKRDKDRMGLKSIDRSRLSILSRKCIEKSSI